jgi:hypothetical protein
MVVRRWKTHAANGPDPAMNGRAGPGAYETAFAAIDGDPAQTLVAVEDAAGDVVGTMQLTLIPGLARGGASRLQVEAVRVAESVRGHGLGVQALPLSDSDPLIHPDHRSLRAVGLSGGRAA